MTRTQLKKRLTAAKKKGRAEFEREIKKLSHDAGGAVALLEMMLEHISKAIKRKSQEEKIDGDKARHVR